ncbi:MAG TPA: hypothetical protein VIJ94_09155 [Caulobacteraceae bacterium]
MLRNYLVTALRNLARNRLYAGISILGLAVAFAAAILIAQFVRNELSYDHWVPGHLQHLQRPTPPDLPIHPSPLPRRSPLCVGDGHRRRLILELGGSRASVKSTCQFPRSTLRRFRAEAHDAWAAATVAA